MQRQNWFLSSSGNQQSPLPRISLLGKRRISRNFLRREEWSQKGGVRRELDLLLFSPRSTWEGCEWWQRLSVAFPAHHKPSTVVWSSWKISREERAFLVLRGVTPCLGRGGENGGVGALWIILKVLHLWRNAGKIGKRWKKYERNYSGNENVPKFDRFKKFSVL